LPPNPANEPGVDTLLRLLAYAIRVEPALLRAVRGLLPTHVADVGSEAAVWRHPEVRVQETAWVLHPEHQPKWRGAAASERDALIQQVALECMRTHHAGLSPAIRHIEELNRALAEGDDLDPRASDFLWRVARTIGSQSPDYRYHPQLKAWVERMAAQQTTTALNTSVGAALAVALVMARGHDPYWHLKIDRVSQYHTVSGEVRQMVRRGWPRCHAYVWYGRRGEGMDLFHKRLKVELRDDLDNARLLEIPLEWPDTLSDPGRSFEDMLCHAFAVDELEAIPATIRYLAGGSYGARVLVYLRHRPVVGKCLINPQAIGRYLQWLDHNLRYLLDEGQFLLLGVSFEVSKPAGFQQAVLWSGLEELRLEQTVFQLLDELDRLALSDLVRFVKTHRIHRAGRLDKACLQALLNKTEGNYEQTVEELRLLMDQVWYETAEEASPMDDDEDDY
jgi:hypothetical protein